MTRDYQKEYDMRKARKYFYTAKSILRHEYEIDFDWMKRFENKLLNECYQLFKAGTSANRIPNLAAANVNEMILDASCEEMITRFK